MVAIGVWLAAHHFCNNNVFVFCTEVYNFLDSAELLINPVNQLRHRGQLEVDKLFDGI